MKMTELKKYPKRGYERYYLVATGGDYDEKIMVFESFTDKSEVERRILELSKMKSPYFSGRMVHEKNIHVVFGREVPFVVDAEIVKKVEVKKG